MSAFARDAEMRLLSLLGAGFIRLVRYSSRLHFHSDTQVRTWERQGRRYILAFWHRHLLLMPYAYRGPGISVLVSRHRDGEIIARTVSRLGIDSCRGSTHRGAVGGLKALLRRARQGCDIAFTPDGPRGPLRQVQPGVILAAALTGLPIQPVALAATRARELSSWDRFVVPLPFGSLHYVYGKPLAVRREDDPEIAALSLQDRLNAAEEEARRYLAAG